MDDFLHLLSNEEAADMDQHERTVEASQQVEKRIGFYVHFAVFILVCAGLAAVNLFATPEVWWAQWPFLGWGVAVVFHGVCAFGRGPNVVAGWRLRKIRELAAAERDVAAGGVASTRTKLFGILLLGIVIGCAGGGYMYVSLQDAHEKTRRARAETEASEKTAKEKDAQLKQMSAEKATLEASMKETKGRLDHAEASKQATEQTVKDLRDQLTQAQAAKDAAERALAEAKKPAAQ